MPRRAGAVRRAGRNRVGHGGRSSHGQAAGAGGTGTESFTNLANDKTFTNVFTQVNKDLKMTDNGDGTLTILGMGAGMSKYLGPDGFLFLDAGQFRFEVLIDHGGMPTDPSDDEEIEGTFRVVRGPDRTQRHRRLRLLRRHPRVHRLTTPSGRVARPPLYRRRARRNEGREHPARRGALRTGGAHRGCSGGAGRVSAREGSHSSTMPCLMPATTCPNRRRVNAGRTPTSQCAFVVLDQAAAGGNDASAAAALFGLPGGDPDNAGIGRADGGRLDAALPIL
jgi:hypothetical protein